MSSAHHMARVARLSCVICLKRLGQRTYPVEVHHVGDPEERNDYAVAALCWEHHQGATGVHGLHRRGFLRMWKASDVTLLAWTNEALTKER
jgi:hypothetical protein